MRVMAEYRRNVACILQNSRGEILICERIDYPGSWQFPQGGLKKGESLLMGLHREVQEELGLAPKNYRVMTRRGPYRYVFSNGLKRGLYTGQEQHYFLSLLTNPATPLRLNGKSPEFRAARWIPPEAFDLGWTTPMRRGVYARVFADFFNVHPRAAKR